MLWFPWARSGPGDRSPQDLQRQISAIVSPGGVPGAPFQVLPRGAQGTSISGTPGTLIASLTAAAGRRFVAWLVQGAMSSSTSGYDVILTYSDATTETIAMGASGQVLFGPGGGQTMNLTAAVQTAAWASVLTKSVTGILVQTNGVGVAARFAIIHAWEVGP